MLIEQDPLHALEAFVEKCGGQRPAALQLGCSNTFVCDMLRGVSPIPVKILTKLNLRRAVVREQAPRGRYASKVKAS